MGYESAGAVFGALADPTRRAIFERLLASGEAPVHDLQAGLGVSQPAVSKHLGVLKRAGLVSGRPSGRTVRYRPEPRALAPLVNWLEHYAHFWEARLDDLESALERMEE
ncbi:MAG TPA: metalloregulator ArsR/SmtB family transcription factor [Deinococcales bacterium]|nr:metalloregulator ArsR/SmtB family transcription factor [Deinococcales bacterium]